MQLNASVLELNPEVDQKYRKVSFADPSFRLKCGSQGQTFPLVLLASKRGSVGHQVVTRTCISSRRLGWGHDMTVQLDCSAPPRWVGKLSRPGWMDCQGWRHNMTWLSVSQRARSMTRSKLNRYIRGETHQVKTHHHTGLSPHSLSTFHSSTASLIHYALLYHSWSCRSCRCLACPPGLRP
jgi:hypothetical protein